MKQPTIVQQLLETLDSAVENKEKAGIKLSIPLPLVDPTKAKAGESIALEMVLNYSKAMKKYMLLIRVVDYRDKETVIWESIRSQSSQQIYLDVGSSRASVTGVKKARSIIAKNIDGMCTQILSVLERSQRSNRYTWEHLEIA